MPWELTNGAETQLAYSNARLHFHDALDSYCLHWHWWRRSWVSGRLAIILVYPSKLRTHFGPCSLLFGSRLWSHQYKNHTSDLIDFESLLSTWVDVRAFHSIVTAVEYREGEGTLEEIRKSPVQIAQQLANFSAWQPSADVTPFWLIR